MAELSNEEIQPFECFSWNIGLRLDSANERSIKDLAVIEEAKHYSRVFFEKVNEVYSIVDQFYSKEQLQGHWASPSNECNKYDAIICGVIALGSLFSGSDAFLRESRIVELGQKFLERWTPVHQSSRSSSTIATACLLRVLYLRMAVDPRAAWQASRSAVLALEGQNGDVSKDEEKILCTIENADSMTDEAQIHRKLYWVARLLDTWIRNEFHPSQWDRVIVSIPCSPPIHSSSSISDCTSTLISLYVISLRFINNPEHKSLPELTQILDDIDALPMSVHDAIQLHKSNHALCVYPFMRCTSAVILRSTLSRIINIAKPGLAAPLRLAKDNQPCWHVLHLPFQLLCVALSMDTMESLDLVNDSMVALRSVHQYLPTKRVQKTVRIAENLVRMCDRKKLEAAETLGRSTEDISGTSEYPNGPGFRRSQATGLHNSAGKHLAAVPAIEASLPIAPEDTDQTGLNFFDWEKFLNSDPFCL